MREQFGDRLKQLRSKKDLTQEELAKIFNTGKASISHYESNRRMPDAITIEKFADFFNVSVDYLLGRTDMRNYELLDKHWEKVEPTLEDIMSKISLDKDLLEKLLAKNKNKDSILNFLNSNNFNLIIQNATEEEKRTLAKCLLSEIKEIDDTLVIKTTFLKNTLEETTYKYKVDEALVSEIEKLSEESKKELEKYIQLLKIKDEADKNKK